MDARRALLERVLDHAPLFPPASLPLDEALAVHAAAQADAASWLLGRFVSPASRLDELGEESLRLSVVLDAEVELLDPRIEAVEVPPGAEPPPHAPAEVYLEGRVEPPFRAKVRCGGARVPSAANLGAFIRRCRSEGVVFKATAGLHHALAADGRHGFLNVLAACVFGDEERALVDDALELDADAFRWRGRAAGPDELARVRRDLFAGFGSCSFDEPVADLRALGVLEP